MWLFSFEVRHLRRVIRIKKTNVVCVYIVKTQLYLLVVQGEHKFFP